MLHREYIEDFLVLVVGIIVFGSVFVATMFFNKGQAQTTHTFVHTSLATQRATTTPQEHTKNTVHSETTTAETGLIKEKVVAETAPEVTHTSSRQVQPTPIPVPTTTHNQQSVTVTESSDNVTFTQSLTALIESKTNAYRKQYELPALTTDPTLAAQARSHSIHMLEDTFFSHTNKAGCDFTCRFNATGYAAQAWGENLAQYTFTDFQSSETVAEFLMQEWLASSGHRKNILTEAFSHQGIGIAVGSNTLYVTVDFAQPITQ